MLLEVILEILNLSYLAYDRNLYLFIIHYYKVIKGLILHILVSYIWFGRFFRRNDMDISTDPWGYDIWTKKELEFDRLNYNYQYFGTPNVKNKRFEKKYSRTIVHLSINKNDILFNNNFLFGSLTLPPHNYSHFRKNDRIKVFNDEYRKVKFLFYYDLYNFEKFKERKNYVDYFNYTWVEKDYDYIIKKRDFRYEKDHSLWFDDTTIKKNLIPDYIKEKDKNIKKKIIKKKLYYKKYLQYKKIPKQCYSIKIIKNQFLIIEKNMINKKLCKPAKK